MRFAVAVSALIVVGGSGLASAKPLACPTVAPATTVVSASEIAPLAKVTNSVDRAAMLARVVATMRDKGMAPSAIVDSLIASYCPAIAADTSLNDQQKTANVRSFAGQAARAAYAFESADEIILDVSIPSAVATTAPYYRSTYVFVTRRNLAPAIESFDDPRLRRLRVGVHLIGDDYANPPPVSALASHGVRNLGCTELKIGGSSPSLDMV